MATVTNIHGFKGMNSDDMKKSYKRLARAMHPDVNPNNPNATRDMQILNAEFSHWYAISARDEVFSAKVKDKPESESYYRAQYHSATYASDLADAINKLLNSRIYTCSAYDVEIIGVFIWVFNVGKDERDIHNELRAIGFNFKMKRDEDSGTTIPAWWYTAAPRRINTQTSKQYMERKYGTQKIYGRNGLPGSAD